MKSGARHFLTAVGATVLTVVVAGTALVALARVRHVAERARMVPANEPSSMRRRTP